MVRFLGIFDTIILMCCTEFQKIQSALGETPDEFPSEMFATNSSPFPDILIGLLGDLPLVRLFQSGIENLF